MLPNTENQGDASLLLGLHHVVMDALDKGTGGVHHMIAPLLQGLLDSPADAVGPKDHRAAHRDFVNFGYLPDPQLTEPLDHMMVMDDRAQGHRGLKLLGSLHDQLHRPVHAKAETGRLRQRHVHADAPNL